MLDILRNSAGDANVLWTAYDDQVGHLGASRVLLLRLSFSCIFPFAAEAVVFRYLPRFRPLTTEKVSRGTTRCQAGPDSRSDGQIIST